MGQIEECCRLKQIGYSFISSVHPHQKRYKKYLRTGNKFLLATLEKSDRDNDENSSTAKPNRNAKTNGEATIKDNIESKVEIIIPGLGQDT